LTDASINCLFSLFTVILLLLVVAFFLIDLQWTSDPDANDKGCSSEKSCGKSYTLAGFLYEAVRTS